MSFGSIGSLTEPRDFLMVLRGLNKEDILFLLRIRVILFVVHWIYERWTFEIWSTKGPLRTPWKVLRLWVLLYPLILKNSGRWDFSCPRWFSSEILRTWVAKVLRKPKFWAGKQWELTWRYCSVWVFLRKLGEKRNHNSF